MSYSILNMTSEQIARKDYVENVIWELGNIVNKSDEEKAYLKEISSELAEIHKNARGGV